MAEVRSLLLDGSSKHLIRAASGILEESWSGLRWRVAAAWWHLPAPARVTGSRLLRSSYSLSDSVETIPSRKDNHGDLASLSSSSSLKRRLGDSDSERPAEFTSESECARSRQQGQENQAAA